jgi:hypothetical protein
MLIWVERGRGRGWHVWQSRKQWVGRGRVWPWVEEGENWELVTLREVARNEEWRVNRIRFLGYLSFHSC